MPNDRDGRLFVPDRPESRSARHHQRRQQRQRHGPRQRHGSRQRHGRRFAAAGVVALLVVTGVLFASQSEREAHAGSIPAASAALDAAAQDALVRPVGPEVTQVVSRAGTRASRSARRTSPKKRAVRPPRWVRPVGGPITSAYGMRWGRMHQGLDFGSPWGSPIYAASDGVITSAGPEGGYGNLVIVDHGGGLETAYGHMSSIMLTSGKVRAGQIIGRVGSTGHSTGPHLHLEVRMNGEAVNPWSFLIDRGVKL
jgi:murein DD-endopeptidase MepM/ murein hydrolase activator NlpD